MVELHLFLHNLHPDDALSNNLHQVQVQSSKRGEDTALKAILTPETRSNLGLKCDNDNENVDGRSKLPQWKPKCGWSQYISKPNSATTAASKLNKC